jgi:flavin reductase (DIM6/NTAB) family NADH-FMN oxidoreductase RutF
MMHHMRDPSFERDQNVATPKLARVQSSNHEGLLMLPDHQPIAPSVLYFGTPVVLMVTRNRDGTANITPMSSPWALGSCVVLGLSSASQGAINLLRSGECTLNFPSAGLWANVERIARTTGVNPVPSHKAEMGFVHESDKFALGGFADQPSELILTPRIAQCPLQFETRLLTSHSSAKQHQGASSTHLIIEVDVLRVHAYRSIVVPGTNHIDTAQWNPLFYVFRHYFGDAVDLGKTFRAEH